MSRGVSFSPRVNSTYVLPRACVRTRARTLSANLSQRPFVNHESRGTHAWYIRARVHAIRFDQRNSKIFCREESIAVFCMQEPSLFILPVLSYTREVQSVRSAFSMYFGTRRYPDNDAKRVIHNRPFKFKKITACAYRGVAF